MTSWKSMVPKSQSGGSGGWKPMRTSSGENNSELPGVRGRYLLWLEPPLIKGKPHFVHFSWMEESFCIRDYINGSQARQDDLGMKASQIWRSAKARIPCKGKELYVPVEEFEHWRRKLEELSREKTFESDEL